MDFESTLQGPRIGCKIGFLCRNSFAVGWWWVDEQVEACSLGMGYLDMGMLMDKAEKNTVGSFLGEVNRFQGHYFHIIDERLTNEPKDRD